MRKACSGEDGPRGVEGVPLAIDGVVNRSGELFRAIGMTQYVGHRRSTRILASSVKIRLETAAPMGASVGMSSPTETCRKWPFGPPKAMKTRAVEAPLSDHSPRRRAWSGDGFSTVRHV
jgi:hypothetical protein